MQHTARGLQLAAACLRLGAVSALKRPHDGSVVAKLQQVCQQSRSIMAAELVHSRAAGGGLCHSSWPKAAAAQMPVNAKQGGFLQALRQLRESHSLAAILAPSSRRATALQTRGLLARLPQQSCRSIYSTVASTATASTAAAKPQVGMAAGLSDGMRRQLVVWLGACSAWVGSMVVLGGVTRLTRSGLSMTDWKFTGERPPQSQTDWEAEFAKYKQSPEYQRVNLGMGLDEFKFIYWMEYAHRMWGRLLGLVFAVPAVYFVARGAVKGPLAARLGLLFGLGGAQGLVGWWMVKSGLQEPSARHETPRVSPYRLAAHLGSAFTIYALLLWTTLSLAYPLPAAASAAPAATRAAARLRGLVHPLAGIIALTALSGAFVAGMDAGRAYNTFPLMAGRLVPEEYWQLPGWRNFFENTAAVQFNHRALAATTLASVTAVWAAGRRLPLPRPSRALLNALIIATAAQVTLGVSTLLTHVPVSLGSAHQAGALTLFTIVLALMHTLRRRPHLLASAARPRPVAMPAAAMASCALFVKSGSA